MDALQALLAKVVDYAGMFPPARLSLETALGRYWEYQQGPDAWMLGSFVVPTGELEALEHLLAQHHPAKTLPLSIIARGGTDPQAWRENLTEDLRRLESFILRQGAQVHVETVEVRLPRIAGWEISPHENALAQLLAQGLPEPTEITGLVSWAVKEMAVFNNSLPRMFLEPPRQGVALPAWYGALTEVASCLTQRNQDQFGLKLRTGGTEPDSTPSTRDVALFLQVCHAFEIHWKATAGLHHPLRHQNHNQTTDSHGFMNLLMAAVMMGSSRFAQSPVLVLSDTDPEHFQFDQRQCSWGLTKDQITADVAAIRRARTRGLCSFGSCDFDEPRQRLRQLGWWQLSSQHG